ncbi:MAG: hypothetical protein IKT79_05510, partial [Akkermansia sp.]|nr:hypothetical protein [Akkermansia sp.]
LEIAGNLTTTDGSSITNTRKPMTVGGDATFQGTEIENADLVAGGDMDFEGSSMNGGSISVGGKLTLLSSDVKAQVATADGSAVLVGSVLSDLTVDGSIKLADGSSFTGVNYDQVMPGILNKMSTVTADSIEIGNNLHSDYSSFTATEGGITIGSGASLEHSHLNAKGDITIEQATLSASDTPEGYTPYGSSEVTSSEGNISIGAGSTLTNTDLTAEKGSVNLTSSTMNGGNIVAGESVVINDSKVTSTTLTAGQNVSIADSTVSGSKVTATADDLTVSGSTVSDTDLTASNGTVSLSGSTYNNDVKGANYIDGETVKIADTTISSTKGGLFIKGDTYVTNGDFVVDGAVDSAITFSGDSERVFDANSSITAITGNVRFGADKTPSGVVISNGAEFTTKGLQGSLQMYSDFIANNDTKITAEKGGMSFYGDVTANDTTSIKATGGNINFFGNVTANAGTTITATGGKTIAFSKNVNLDGSELTADNGKIEFNGGLVAKDTTFTTNSQANNTFIFNAGEIRLDGGNKLIAVDGTNGTFAFRNGANVIANGANTIDGVVTMADGAKLTAQSGTLDITTRGTSSLNNVQQTGGAQINVTANGGSLNLKGTSTIESLRLNNTTSNNTGTLTTSNLVSTGGKIDNTGSLTVNQTSQLTGTTLTSTGTAAFKGDVTSVDSKIVINDGQMKFSETVTATGGEYTAKGGNMNFHGDVNANGTTFTTDGGIIRFYGDVVAENTTFVADGTAPMYFDTETNLTRDKNTVTLNGGNTFEAKDSYFSFSGIDFIANGDNTFKGGFSMGDDSRSVYKLDENGNYVLSPSGRKEKETITVESSFIAHSGVQTIESDKYSIRLNNIKIAEDAAEGTKINVTSSAEHMDVYVRGNSSISNLTVLDGAKGFIQGNVNIAEKLVVDSAKSDSITVEETGALTAENVEIKENSGLL